MPVTIKENVSLAPHTIYKIGGPARYFVEVKSKEEIIEVLEWAVENGISFFTPHPSSADLSLRKAQPTKGAGFILGAGSNTLVSDKGFEGLVIKMNMRGLHLAGSGKLVAESGVSMAQAVLASAKAGLTGLEWGIGIPGTMGGSVRGNAGCFGGEMAQVLERAQVLELKTQNSKLKTTTKNPKAIIFELTNQQCGFAYRDSIFKRHPEWVILSATLNLKKGDPQEIQENIKRITAERTQKQDIGTKSCGCIFKNVSWEDADKEAVLKKFPELEQFADKPNIPASYLIDHAGLKGRRVGHVFISPKHANYFVNEGGATAEEVMTLVAVAKDEVRNKYDLSLEEEIQYVGF